MHQITVVGKARNVKMYFTSEGVPITTFDVSSYDYGSKKTTFFHVASANKIAELISEKLKNGDTVVVIGRLSSDESGNPKVFNSSKGICRAKYEIYLDKIEIINNEKDENEITDQ